MQRRSLYAIVFSVMLLGLLSLSYVLYAWLGFDWLYLLVFGIVLAGVVLLRPFQLLFMMPELAERLAPRSPRRKRSPLSTWSVASRSSPSASTGESTASR
ncbi:hypothetical protein Pyrde_0687 [Pyrodictium delaneyi]|uniref:Uncharacterized protein n=1 Tax=Pyrodictium delaneyi TaxID=1273541 RepID=A0A0N7JCZ1_9CREN|nr:hypothetical protein [Pyrodictium delaneyi]ALL00737.1 hypothetical protein Pyrde_0687 [Pyrodictium delaneyi]